MVHVLVCEKNPCEVLRGRFQSCKERSEAFGAEACVDQNRGLSRLGKNGISRAATGEDGDMNHERQRVSKKPPLCETKIAVQDRACRKGGCGSRAF